MADGENNIAPRPTGTYWAAVPATELGTQVQSRYLEYVKELQLRGLIGLWQRIESVHYGYDPHTDSLADWVKAGGEEGELLKLHVNEFGSLIRHQLILTTSDKLDFECVPVNDAPEAEAQASLGEQIIRYYMGDGKVEPVLVQSVLRALLGGKSYVTQLWDAFKGPEVGVEEVQAYGEDGEPLTQEVEVELPPEPAPMAMESLEGPMPPSGLQQPPRVEKVQQPVTHERVRRAGDLVHRVYSPVDVAHDIGLRTGEDATWFIVRERLDRYEAAARYPEHRAYIFGRPAFNRDESAKWEREAFSDSSALTQRTDQIHLYRVLHDRTEAMPQGLEAVVCGEVVLEPPRPLAYRRLPVHPMAPQEVLDTPIGYPEALNLLGPQAAMNASASNALTSSDAGSVPKYAIARNTNVQVENLAPNLRAVYYTPQAQVPNGGIPVLMDTPELRDTHLKGMDTWREAMQRISGINAVVRGESEGKSGADNALISAQATQYMSASVFARVLQARSVALGMIECLQVFADDERLVRIVGDDEAPSLQYFTKDDLRDIRHVEVDIGDAALRTFPMKMQLASELQSRFPQQVTPEQFLSFIATGRLEPLYKAQRNQVRLIRAENAQLAKGNEPVPTKVPARDELGNVIPGAPPITIMARPVQALIADCHLDHIREHLALLSSPSLRMNPQLAEAVLAHVTEHETQWQQLAMRPALLAASAQPPPPPPPGMPMPMGPDGAPPDGNSPPGPDGGPPPAERAKVGGREEVNGVPLPSAPDNAATGEPAPLPNAAMGGVQ